MTQSQTASSRRVLGCSLASRFEFAFLLFALICNEHGSTAMQAQQKNANISPTGVLKKLPGINDEVRDSRQLYFRNKSTASAVAQASPLELDETLNVRTAAVEEDGSAVRQTQSTAHELASLRTTSTTQHNLATAVATCLRGLSAANVSTGWPASKEKLKADMKGLFSISQLARMFPGISARQDEPNKVWKQASGRVVHFLTIHHCVEKLKGGRLVWNQNRTSALLSSTRPLAATTLHAPSPRLVSRQQPPVRHASQICDCANNKTTAAKSNVVFVDTDSVLEVAVATITAAVKRSSQRSTDEESSAAGAEPCLLACDCEGVPGNLLLLQLALAGQVFVFDCLKLGPRHVCSALSEVFADRAAIKLFHDLHKDALALATVGGVDELRGTLDTQLVVEHLRGDLHVGLNGMLEFFGCEPHAGKKETKRKMQDGRASALFAQRPLAPEVVRYAAEDVSLLLAAGDKILAALGGQVRVLRAASDRRATTAISCEGRRQITFDVKSQYRPASRELMEAMHPESMWQWSALTLSDDAQPLLDLLPDSMAAPLRDRTATLADICLDMGRRPHAWVRGERVFLGDEESVVRAHDIQAIVGRLGGFGSDNRAGLERQLHRVSGMRNRAGDVVGLTMRVGRHVGGNADMIADLLLGTEGSVLILGQPGCGKTTIVREVSRVLSEQFNVCIVDTSNEIAGDGDVPHPCVGFARRMMVPALSEQSRIMVQCVQNHSPDVMVIDEIGRVAEVEAARTCKQRGVRMIASAHGDLRKVLRNRELRGLLGGVETVILGDAQAKAEGKMHRGDGEVGSSKLKRVRSGEPTFDVVIELTRGEFHRWKVVQNVAGAVDAVLEGRQYPLQLRVRDPVSGSMQMELDSA